MSKSKIGAHTGAVLFVSAMYMHLRYENLPNKNQKQLKWYTFFSTEQLLILYLAQLNPWLFWYEIILNTDKA